MDGKDKPGGGSDNIGSGMWQFLLLGLGTVSAERELVFISDSSSTKSLLVLGFQDKSWQQTGELET